MKVSTYRHETELLTTIELTLDPTEATKLKVTIGCGKGAFPHSLRGLLCAALEEAG